jgi:hypothetical protein
MLSLFLLTLYLLPSLVFAERPGIIHKYESNNKLMFYND